MGAIGLDWDQDMIATPVTDLRAWLQGQTGDATAKSRMTLKLGQGGADVSASLASLPSST